MKRSTRTLPSLPWLLAAATLLAGCERAPPAIELSPSSGLITTEAGGTASFTVTLASPPTATVTIPVSSSDTSEGTVSPAELSFSASDWTTPKTVTVTGADDGQADGNQPYEVAFGAIQSSDAGYAAITLTPVAVTNQDDDVVGVVVTPTSGLTTNEWGGTDSFTIHLGSEPAADVNIPLSSSDEAEGEVTPGNLTFTAANWSTPQTVTVTGVDDADQDGPQGYTAVTGAAGSTDPGYDGLAVPDVSITNLDDDTPGLVVTPTSGLSTTEAGGTDSFTVRVTSNPGAEVTVSVTPLDDEVAVSDATLTFNASNWLSAQTVDVTGLDDPMDDGDVTFQLEVAVQSGSAEYLALDPVTVSGANVDDDTAALIVTAEGLTVHESGTQDTFTVALGTPPGGEVFIDVEANPSGEVTFDTTSLVFDGTNWADPQTVTVTGDDDTDADGFTPVEISITPSSIDDAAYDALGSVTIEAINRDDDPGRASLSTSGNQANDESTEVVVSSDGRWVAFVTDADNLVAADTNGLSDVFLHDRQTLETRRLTFGVDTFQADGNSYHVAISDDGTRVAFASDATNLVSGDTNGAADVFVWDRLTGATTRVSVDSEGSEVAGVSWRPSLSADGRYVAFSSDSDDLDLDDLNGPTRDVFVHDQQTGVTVLASAPASGGSSSGASDYPRISADGSWVVFESGAALDAGDANTGLDVYLRDLVIEETTHVTFGGAPFTDNLEPDLSDDARYVVLSSDDDWTGDSTTTFNVYLFDVVTTDITLVSMDDLGFPAGGASPTLSGEGLRVLFASAGDLLFDDTNGVSDVYLYDVTSGENVRVSLDETGAEHVYPSYAPRLSASGTSAAFLSEAALEPSDSTGAADAYVVSWE